MNIEVSTNSEDRHRTANPACPRRYNPKPQGRQLSARVVERQECGGFDLTDLWNVYSAIAVNMVIFFGLLAGRNVYPDTLGYHSGAGLEKIKENEVRTYILEKNQVGKRHWKSKEKEQRAVYQNRQRVRGDYGKSLLRRRSEFVERSFAHCYETGGMRRCTLRGRKNILKRQLIHVGAFNISLMLRQMLGAGAEEPRAEPYFTDFLVPHRSIPDGKPDSGLLERSLRSDQQFLRRRALLLSVLKMAHCTTLGNESISMPTLADRARDSCCHPELSL